MTKIIGVLLILVSAVLFISCDALDGEAEVAAAHINLNQACDDERAEVISINLNQDEGALAHDVKISFRRNGGEWTHREHVSGSTLITGLAGIYEIKAQKPGQMVKSATVIVAYGETCQILKQEVQFNFKTASCLQSIPMVIHISEPAVVDGLYVSVKIPGQAVVVRPCSLSYCQFNLSPTTSGIYEVIFSGLPDNRQMILSDGSTFRYEYTRVEIKIAVQDREHQIISEGVDTLTIKVPYEVGNYGCFEVNFDGLAVESTSVTAAESGRGNLYGGPIYHVYPANSSQCLQLPQAKQIHFGINVQPGTEKDENRVQYWFQGEWKPAQCNFANGGYFCSADITNPFLANKYHIRTLVNNTEIDGAIIPLDNSCIYFE